MYVCKAGHIAIRKTWTHKKSIKKKSKTTYDFDVGKCKVCPFHEGCYKEGMKSRTYSVTIKSAEPQNKIKKHFKIVN